MRVRVEAESGEPQRLEVLHMNGGAETVVGATEFAGDFVLVELGPTDAIVVRRPAE